MGLKEQCGFITGFDTGFFCQFTQLFDSLFLGCLETGPFGFGIIDLIAADGALGTLVIIQGTDCYTGRGAFSLNGSGPLT